MCGYIDLKALSALGCEPVKPTTRVGVCYVHSDHLNTPRILTDQNQAKVWEVQTTPFGEVSEEISQGITQLKGFPGQMRDPETGYSDNWHRTYDPSIGRYLQSDLIGLNGGLNTYAYVGGNPLSYTDPMGLATQYNVGAGITGALAFLGAGGGINFGFSIPDNWKNWRCYQFFGGIQMNGMVGGGAYGGFGITAGSATSDGPLNSASIGGYRYEEFDAGWGISGGVSVTGSENIASGGAWDWLGKLFDPDGWNNDSVGGFGFTPLPHFGAGYGVWAGAGYTVSGSFATPTFGDECECQ